MPWRLPQRRWAAAAGGQHHRAATAGRAGSRASLLGTVEGVYHKGMPDEGAWEAPEDRFGLDAAVLRTTFRRRERPAATQVTNW